MRVQRHKFYLAQHSLGEGYLKSKASVIKITAHPLGPAKNNYLKQLLAY